VRDLQEQISHEEHMFVNYAGSPLHQHTPLHPITHQLYLAAGINREDSMEQRRTKLDALFEPMEPHEEDCISLIAELVASPSGLEDLRSRPPSRDRMEQLLRFMVGYFEFYARRHPVCLVFEDYQWVDATTRELLDRLMRGIASLPIFQIVTFRPGASVPWRSGPQVTALDLHPLDKEACVEMVKSVLRNRDLPAGVTEAIVFRTDGIPLFLEELTKSVLEAQDEDKPADTVPETLRDTLMARLDRHQGARSIAQIAAAIGREFPYELLAMIAPVPAAELHEALSELLRSELIFQRGLPPRATYAFKHALIQEIAYETLLHRHRRSVHGQIARTLHTYFPETPPELVGHHYAEAGEVLAAIAQYECAAEIARGQSANAEAAAHFARALELLDQLPPGEEHAQRELGLQIAYGAQLVAVRGNAASEVGKAFHRALVLSQKYGTTRQTSRALRGLQTFYMVRGALPNARPIGARMLEEAQKTDDDDLLLEAHRPHGLCLLYMGELAAARHHLQRAGSLYDPVKHAQHRFLYGSDPSVLAHCNLAWVEWFLGFPERARHHAETALELSEQPRRHPHSRAFALSFATSLDQFRGEPDKACRRAESLIRLADRHHFAYWASWGHVLRGWAGVMTTGERAGLEELRSGLRAYRATGAGLMCPYFLGLESEALGRLGLIAEGLSAVDQALMLAGSGDIRFYKPELHAVRADLLRAKGAPSKQRTACLQQALAEAKQQDSRAHQLRALIGLSRELTDVSDRAQALDQLREVLAGFGPGDSCKAIFEARSILDSKRPQ